MGEHIEIGDEVITILVDGSWTKKEMEELTDYFKEIYPDKRVLFKYEGLKDTETLCNDF